MACFWTGFAGSGWNLLCCFSSFLQGQWELIEDDSSSLQPPAIWMSQGLVLSLLLFNINMKPLSKIICPFGMRWCRWYSVTYLHVRLSECCHRGTASISWVYTFLYGNSMLQLNPCKIKWLWVLGLSLVFRTFHFLFWMGLHCLRQILCSVWGLSCTNNSCSKRRVFEQASCCMQIAPFLNQEALFIVSHALITS